MDNVNLMKMFLAMGEITQQTKEEKLAYKERIVFATPGIIKPSNWESLSLEEREKRIDNLNEIK